MRKPAKAPVCIQIDQARFRGLSGGFLGIFNNAVFLGSQNAKFA